METFKYKGKKYEIVEDIYTDDEIRNSYKSGLCLSKNNKECFFRNYENEHCIDLINEKIIPDCVQYRENERYHRVFLKKEYKKL